MKIDKNEMIVGKLYLFKQKYNRHPDFVAVHLGIEAVKALSDTIGYRFLFMGSIQYCSATFWDTYKL